MTTKTRTRTRTRKPAPPRTLRIVEPLLEGRDGDTLRLCLTVSGKAAFYSVTHLHHGHSESFLWLKQGGTTHKTEFFNGQDARCDCEYFREARRGTCKHLAALRKLRVLGVV